MILIGDRVEQGLGVLPPLVLIPSSLGPILHDAPVGPECSCPCHFPTMAADGRVVNAVRPTSTGSVIGREATSHPPRPVSGPGHAPEARRAWGSLTRDAGPGPILSLIRIIKPAEGQIARIIGPGDRQNHWARSPESLGHPTGPGVSRSGLRGGRNGLSGGWSDGSSGDRAPLAGRREPAGDRAGHWAVTDDGRHVYPGGEGRRPEAGRTTT